VFLKDIWPDSAEVQATIDSSIDTAMFTKEYGEVFEGDERWRALPTPDSEVFEWDPESTYVRKPRTSTL
jgi:aconitate hydratase